MYCDDCGAYNSKTSSSCLNCGCQFRQSKVHSQKTEPSGNSLAKNSSEDDVSPDPNFQHTPENLTKTPPLNKKSNLEDSSSLENDLGHFDKGQESSNNNLTHLSFVREDIPKDFSQYRKNNDTSKSKNESNLVSKYQARPLKEKKKRLKIGTIFAEKYRVDAFIDEGGMGEIYKVLDLVLNEARALKLLHVQLFQKKQMLERFKNEAYLLSKIVHINILRTGAFQTFQNNAFIVMEYIDGISLRQWIDKKAQIADITDVFNLIIQLTQALTEVHKYTVHRDIKPENILITNDGCLKLMDFGIAKIKDEASSIKTQGSMGTAYYMSPEQLQDSKKVSPASDIFSLGVILYEMLFFKIPIGHFQIPIVKDRFISYQFAEIIKKALNSEQDKRYQLVEDLLCDLKEEYDVIRKEKLKNKEDFFISKIKKNFWSKMKSQLFLLFSLLSLLFCFFIVFSGPYLLLEYTNGNKNRTDPSLKLDLINKDNQTISQKVNPHRVLSKKLRMKFSFIPTQTFERGDFSGKGDEDELPLRKIKISSFYMGQFEVSNREYLKFVNHSGYFSPVNVFGSSSEFTLWKEKKVPHEILDHPVVNVSWEDAHAFCKWLSEYENVPEGTYRIPTEAEWEVAARGGKVHLYPWGDEEPDQNNANFNKVWLGPFTLKKVGTFKPNPYGLYDMAGNVWEWCEDVYYKRYYYRAPVLDPVAKGAYNKNVLRGGGWNSYSSLLRVSNRAYDVSNSRYYYNGFRVTRQLNTPPYHPEKLKDRIKRLVFSLIFE